MTATNTTVPDGFREISEEDRKKARRFFDHARAVAATGQFDYAIDMFISGLTLDPEDVEQHKALRDLSLKRRVSGGKPMNILTARKYPTSTKDDKQNMLNAERQLAWDPGNIGHMLTFAQGAFRGGFYDTANWIADICLRANAESPKPDFHKFIVLKDIYKGMNNFSQATEACAAALQLRREDQELQGEMRSLAAQDTMNRGKYHTGGSFKNSIRNMGDQQKLLEDEKDFKSEDILLRKIADTEKEWRAAPEDLAKFGKYIDALRSTEMMEYENVAIEALDEMYHKTRQFKFRQKAGEIKISQLNRMYRAMDIELRKDPGNAQKKKELREFQLEKTHAELEEYRLVTENYPTDTTARFKMAERMFQLGQYQDVIPVLQQCRHDPKFRATAGTLLGQAFLEAGFTDEAVDTLRTVLDDYPTRGDERYKNITYWYGRALEIKGDGQGALKQFSLVAQMEFKYKDVQERIKKLRAEGVK